MQELLDRGASSLATEIVQAEKISRGYVGRILRLALLAPDIRRGDPGRVGGSEGDTGEDGAAVAGGVGGAVADVYGGRSEGPSLARVKHVN